MLRKKTYKKGFTLSELLVILVVVAVLGAVALPMYTKAVKRSKAGDALKVLSLASARQELYLINNNEYAKNFTDLSAPVKGLSGTGEVTLGNFTYKLQDSCIIAMRPSDKYTIYKNFVTQQESCMGEGCDALEGMIPATGVADGCELVESDYTGGSNAQDPCIKNPALCTVTSETACSGINEIYNPNTKGCDCKDVCAGGYSYKAKSCECECPATACAITGQTRNALCQCVCPAGQVSNGTACVTQTTGSCPEGQILKNGICVPNTPDTIACTGTKPDNEADCGKCGKKTRSVTCNTTTGRWDTGDYGNCTGEGVCTAGSANCSSSCQCNSGYSWDGSVCKPDSECNGDACCTGEKPETQMPCSYTDDECPNGISKYDGTMDCDFCGSRTRNVVCNTETKEWEAALGWRRSFCVPVGTKETSYDGSHTKNICRYCINSGNQYPYTSWSEWSDNCNGVCATGAKEGPLGMREAGITDGNDDSYYCRNCGNDNVWEDWSVCNTGGGGTAASKTFHWETISSGIAAPEYSPACSNGSIDRYSAFMECIRTLPVFQSVSYESSCDNSPLCGSSTLHQQCYQFEIQHIAGSCIAGYWYGDFDCLYKVDECIWS